MKRRPPVGVGQVRASVQVPPRVLPAGAVPQPPPAGPPRFVREPWKATVYPAGWRGRRWRIRVTSGMLVHGWDWGGGVDDFRAWGSRERAERKAKRIVDRVNARDARDAKREAEGTEIR